MKSNKSGQSDDEPTDEELNRRVLEERLRSPKVEELTTLDELMKDEG